MKYNTAKPHLVLSSYGRIVQDMVSHAMRIEDRNERTRCARTIVRVMAQTQGLSLNNIDTNQKLWDHLAEISDFKLDIDYPVTVTTREEREVRPVPPQYPTKHIRHRHYGANIEATIAHLLTLDEGEERNRLTSLVANQMKRMLAMTVNDLRLDDRIRTDFERYTEGRIKLGEDFRFVNINAPVSQGSNSLAGKKSRKKKSRK